MKNLVLIGMPSCGKTTVGALLAKQLSLPFYDTDAQIVSRIGMPIADYFASYGESAFRRIESEVIAELSKQDGCVLATGGGAILAQENVRALKENGILLFLDRPLSLLLTTADRPLSQDRAALEALYQVRYPRYCACADLRIEATLSPAEIVSAIRKELGL